MSRSLKWVVFVVKVIAVVLTINDVCVCVCAENEGRLTDETPGLVRLSPADHAAYHQISHHGEDTRGQHCGER